MTPRLAGLLPLLLMLAGGLAFPCLGLSVLYEGNVYDSVGGGPVTGAVVTVANTTLSAATSSSGLFTIEYSDATDGRAAKRLSPRATVSLLDNVVTVHGSAGSATRVEIFSVAGKCLYRQTRVPSAATRFVIPHEQAPTGFVLLRVATSHVVLTEKCIFPFRNTAVQGSDDSRSPALARDRGVASRTLTVEADGYVSKSLTVTADTLRGIMFRLVKAGDTTATEKLTWAPPTGWQNFQTLNITAPGTYTLNASTDYWVSAPNRIDGEVIISGGRNVVWIGGHIHIPNTSVSRRGMIVRSRESDPVRTVFLEGLLIDGPYLIEGIDTDDKWGRTTLVLQNMRVGPVVDNPSSSHPDIIQTWGNIRELRIDKFTGLSAYQGFFMRAAHLRNSPDPFTGQSTALTKHGPVHMRRTNIRAVQANDAAGVLRTGHRMYFWMPYQEEVNEGRGELQSAPNQYLDNGSVWAQHYPQSNSGSTFGHNIYPGTHNYPTTNYQLQLGTDALGTYGYWKTTATLKDGSIAVRNFDNTAAGRVYSGTPPAGDYVSAGVAGRSYQSPGYR